MKKRFQSEHSSTRLILTFIAVLIALSPGAGRAQSAGATPGPKLPPLPKQAPAPKPAAESGELTKVTTAVENGRLTVSLSTSGPVSHQEFALTDPSRLVIDFPNVENKISSQSIPIHAVQVKQLRIRQFQSSDPKIARLVFDLEDGHGDYQISSDKQSLRVVFYAKPAESPAQPAAPRAGTAERAQQKTPSSGQKAAEQPAKKTGPAELKDKNTISEKPPVVATSPKAAPSVPPQVSERKSPSGSSQLNPVITRKRSVASSPSDLHNVVVPLVRAEAKADVPKTGLVSAGLPEQQAVITPQLRQPVVAAPVAALAGRPTTESIPKAASFGHPLTLDLVEISLVDFFRLMAEEGGINVVMDPEIKGTISIKVVKVPWDQIFEAALLNNGLDKQMEGNLVRIARKSTLQEEAKQREALKKANMLASDVETRIKRLNYAKATTLLNTLVDQKTVRGTVVVDERTNSLILTDLPSSIDRMTQLIESLDTPQPQVEIEARIVSATRDFARDIGVQFGFVQGNLERVTVGGPNTFGTIGGTRPTATPTNTFAAGNTRTGRGASESTSSESAGVSTGTSSNNAGNLNVNLPAQRAFGGLGISVGNIFDTFLLDAAITAGENRGLAKLISQPKVTAQNNNAAVITQGLRFPVQIIANNTVTVQFQNAALTLTVTPQITYEGNVVLDLKVENNTPDFSKQVNGIPSIRTSESTTRVLVTDGGTTVIGGILIDNETTQEDRVPGLASLPLVGNVFKRSAVSHSTQEVLFFITPKVIK